MKNPPDKNEKLRLWIKANPDKWRGYERKYRSANKDVIRRIHNAMYKWRYGLSTLQVDAMVAEQRGKCLICNKKKKLVVDHCHKTGKIRGMLCASCNLHLGLYETWKDDGIFDRYITQ